MLFNMPAKKRKFDEVMNYIAEYYTSCGLNLFVYYFYQIVSMKDA